ncbi:hypothetical protein GCM10010245_67470 [Streptomyces spectabilis]|nr:hypothetical protein GCM10010245_67470 [Streptomyces spectabilis]
MAMRLGSVSEPRTMGAKAVVMRCGSFTGGRAGAAVANPDNRPAPRPAGPGVLAISDDSASDRSVFFLAFMERFVTEAGRGRGHEL